MKQGIKEKDIVRFEKACERVAKIMRDIQKYNPNAHMFCNMDSLELFGVNRESDIEYHEFEPIVSVHVPNTDCGER